MPSGSFVNKNQYSSRIRSAEQCWLVANATKIVDSNPQEKVENKLLYKHAYNTHHISLGANTNLEEVYGRLFGNFTLQRIQISKTSKLC